MKAYTSQARPGWVDSDHQDPGDQDLEELGDSDHQDPEGPDKPHPSVELHVSNIHFAIRIDVHPSLHILRIA